MATVVVGYMFVHITVGEGTGIKQIQPKSGLLPEANIYWLLTCYHGNHTSWVRGCAKFDAHTHYHCQVINNNRNYPKLLTVARATIVVDST